MQRKGAWTNSTGGGGGRDVAQPRFNQWERGPWSSHRGRGGMVQFQPATWDLGFGNLIGGRVAVLTAPLPQNATASLPQISWSVGSSAGQTRWPFGLHLAWGLKMEHPCRNWIHPVSYCLSVMFVGIVKSIYIANLSSNIVFFLHLCCKIY